MIWPFSRTPRDLSTLPPLTEEESEWAVALIEYDEKPTIIRRNQSAKKWSGHKELPVKLGFAIPLQTLVEGGLPDPEENEVLDSIEDQIIETLASKTVGIYALAITNGEMKEFIFYIPENVDIKSIHEYLQKKVTSHEVQCLAEMDNSWNIYKQFKI
jgi:hypothetical protein